MKNHILCVALVLALAACTTGKKIESAQLAEFKKNETSIHQVIASLGEPNFRMNQADGSTWIYYNYSKTIYGPHAIIPIVNQLPGAMEYTSSTVQFHFDQDGKMLEYSTMSYKN